MKEYIEREALEKDFNSRLNDLVAEYGQYDHYVRGFEEAVDRLEDAPAADVVEVRHGRWEERPVNVDTPTTDLFCSECNFASYHWRYNYCPICGAIMDKEE